MKILLVAPFFPPLHDVASLRTHAFADTWAKAGHDVTVLTTAKRADHSGLDLPCDGFEVNEIAYPVPRLLEKLRGQHKTPTAPATSRGWFAWLRRLRTTTGVFSSVRMPDLTDFWVQPAIHWARRRARRDHGWDVVVSSSGPYTANLVARSLRRHGLALHWLADFRDLWTDNHIYRGLFPFTLRERRLEAACLRDADQFTAATDGLADKLRAKTSKSVETIYNGTDPAAHAALPEERFFPDDGMRRLVYTGTLYPHGQDASLLWQAMQLLRKRDPRALAKLRFVVAGAGCPLWCADARSQGFADLLDVRGSVPRADALRMQRDADALLLVDWRDPSQGVLTGKVFEYFQSSAPIALVSGSATSSLARLVAQANRGHVLRDASSLADLLADPSRFTTSPNRALLATLTRSHQSQRMLALFDTSPPRRTLAA
jgi:glycosyltransferase involved in cell wall biosynthesis